MCIYRKICNGYISGSGSVEPLGRFTRNGTGFGPRFLGPVQTVFFWRFHGSAVRASSEPVANGYGSGTVSSGSGSVRFRETRSVAIPIHVSPQNLISQAKVPSNTFEYYILIVNQERKEKKGRKGNKRESGDVQQISLLSNFSLF